MPAPTTKPIPRDPSTARAARAEGQAAAGRIAAGVRDARAEQSIGFAVLLATDFPPPRWVVDELIPEGLTILAGRPKSGKSWLAYQVAIAAAAGQPCLGRLATAGGGRAVLALMLEDTRRRAKDRGLKLVRGAGLTPTDRLEVRTACPRAGEGGLAAVQEWFQAHPSGLVLVDTLAKFRDRVAKGNQYDADYQAVAELKAVADLYGGAVLALHHTRKGAADDPFDEVSGTLGINGAADSILVLERGRGDAGGVLFSTGRDLPERTLTLEFAPDSGVWTATNSADGIERPGRGKDQPKASDKCACWLPLFLGNHCWPEKEVLAAAKSEGYSFDAYRSAKAALRSAEPPLRSKPEYPGGPWWCWIGHDRPHARPVSGTDTSDGSDRLAPDRTH